MCIFIRKVQAHANDRRVEPYDTGTILMDGAPPVAAAQDAVLHALQDAMVEAVPAAHSRRHRRAVAGAAADVLHPRDLLSFLKHRLAIDASEDLREHYLELLSAVLPYDPHGERALLYGELEGGDADSGLAVGAARDLMTPSGSGHDSTVESVPTSQR